MTNQPDSWGSGPPLAPTIARKVLANDEPFPAIAASSITLITLVIVVDRIAPVNYACRATIVGGSADGRCALCLVAGDGSAMIGDSLIDARDSGNITAGKEASIDLVGWWEPLTTGAQSVSLKAYRPGASAGAFSVLGDHAETETSGLFSTTFSDTPTVLELSIPN